MGQPNVVATAMIACSFGLTPSTLDVIPESGVMIEGRPAATIMNIVPIVNVAPFGMCTSLSNPEVASATAAALGVLTPMPCVPVVPAPWHPGATTTLIGGFPALVAGSSCLCAWGGQIMVTMPGAMQTTSA